MRQIIEDGKYKSTEDRSILNKYNLHILIEFGVESVMVVCYCGDG